MHERLQCGDIFDPTNRSFPYELDRLPDLKYCWYQLVDHSYDSEYRAVKHLINLKVDEWHILDAQINSLFAQIEFTLAD